MQALKIRCHLMSGFCANDPYSPAIDGILGYALRREQLTDEQFAQDVAHYANLPAVDGLPLAVERYQDDWWYHCSLPMYTEQAVFNRYIHRRFNVVEAEDMLPGVKKIETTKGAYKNSRLLLQQHITSYVDWHVIGDKSEIERLLNSITHIGKRVGAGFGRVRHWEVTEGEQDIARFFRPLPREFASLHQIKGDLMQWGIKPPAKNNQRVCVMPFSLES